MKILLLIVSLVNTLTGSEFLDFIIFIICLIIVIYRSIVIIIFSGKKFICFSCGRSFRPSLFRLIWQPNYLRVPRRFRENREVDGVTYEKVWVKCPSCKYWDCGAEKKTKYIKKA